MHTHAYLVFLGAALLFQPTACGTELVRPWGQAGIAEGDDEGSEAGGGRRRSEEPAGGQAAGGGAAVQGRKRQPGAVDVFGAMRD